MGGKEYGIVVGRIEEDNVLVILFCCEVRGTR